eukprot:tig00000042_g15662.t1
MGRSEWGIRIATKSDAELLASRVRCHNNPPEEADPNDYGEPLQIYAVLRFRGALWACAGNGGGRESTSKFLASVLPERMKILHPFQKPKGWDRCENYAWMMPDPDVTVSYEDAPEFSIAQFERWVRDEMPAGPGRRV